MVEMGVIICSPGATSILLHYIDTPKFHNLGLTKMSVMCKWCEEKFENYAILEIHRMFKDGNPSCPQHPDLPKKYDRYSQLTTNTNKTRTYKPRRTKPHKRIK